MNPKVHRTKHVGPTPVPPKPLFQAGLSGTPSLHCPEHGTTYPTLSSEHFAGSMTTALPVSLPGCAQHLTQAGALCTRWDKLGAERYGPGPSGSRDIGNPRHLYFCMTR